MRTSWLCRIGRLEQDVARRLFTLASGSKLHIALAFVFSHVGGVIGNKVVDARAKRACTEHGHEWTNSLRHADTTRRILHKRHDRLDLDAASFNATGGEPTRRLRIPLQRDAW